ncbi:murein hydrolase activator EnvC [Evansella sp. AB-rgal1]|uniref:murein hydrolase activator EnvC family protein n=1 Tax=Evansella sp. AB-rgal1 TaxID=3242696 RepID=UPI00359E8DCB
MNRIVLVFFALLLGFSTFIGTQTNVFVQANEGEEFQKQIESYQEQQGELDGDKRKAEQELQRVESEIREAAEEIRLLDEETSRTNAKIREKQDEIDATKLVVEELREEIEILEERIAQRDELLKDRVRSMYQTGGVINYIEVILGAQNFGDLIERVSALNTIAQQDKNILEQHRADKEAVELAKLQLEEELTSLEEQMVELEGLLKTLEAQRSEKNRLVKKLEEKQINLEDQLVTYEEEQMILKAQENAAKAQLKEWEDEQRRLEEERKRREEEERKRLEEERRQQELQRQQQQTQTNSSDSGTNNSTTSNTPPPSNTSSAVLMRPATGAITSGYGMRWGRMHHGIDIGQGGRSNVPIVAAESGTVVYSGWMNGYGNTILISHFIGGRQLTTLYAHLDALHVSGGQRVNRGQQIGIMGNTGQSTGPHLHFEVHEGGWNGAKSNSRNPMNYIN